MYHLNALVPSDFAVLPRTLQTNFVGSVKFCYTLEISCRIGEIWLV